MAKKMPIFYSALMLTGVNLLLRFVSTSFQVFVSRKIGAAGIGLLQLVLSVGALAMTAGMAGIRTATMYLTAEELGRRKPQNVTWILSGCFVYSIVCSGAICIALHIFAPFLAEKWVGDIQTVGSVRLYASFIPIYCLCGVMTGYFTAANRIGTLAIVEIGEQLIYMAITFAILTLWAGNSSQKACESIVFGSGISSACTLLALIVLRIGENAKTGQRIPVRSRLMQAALPLALADDLKAGISTTENLMVPKRLALYPHAENPLAAFGMVCGMVFPILMFPAAILFALAELLIPEMARCAAAGSTQRTRYLAKRSLRVCMIYGFTFCALEFLFADELCLKLYNNSQAGAQLRLYALLIPVLYCDAITDAMIKGLGQQKICVRYNILTSGMDVVFLFFLLPKYGMMGYFFSFLVTHLLNFGLSLRRLLKIVGNVVQFHIPLLAAIATAISVWCAQYLQQPLFKTGAFLLIYGSLLVLFQVIKKEDITWITGLVHKKTT
ncbi:MAG: polysaccharide biosynthesis C-terminal domain-containing protein [Oscillospiraceae bacterium]|nr:polysaccharide biosynthesis C-terminal domain-containing protein [Oscillospiraceae bacterium]